MNTPKKIADRVRDYLADTGLKKSAFGRSVAKDPKLYDRVMEGRIALRMVARIEAFIEANPPPEPPAE
tara:strand:+ start:8827 stop:9030 length:204 start_codon:yes stop_codon:yes gene_type:complete